VAAKRYPALSFSGVAQSSLSSSLAKIASYQIQDTTYKSQSSISSYFPQTSIHHYILPI
jgi:hypothetical protein